MKQEALHILISVGPRTQRSSHAISDEQVVT